MIRSTIRRQSRLGTALAALALTLGTAATAAPAAAQPSPSTYRPTSQTLLSTGEGTVIRLPSAVADVWLSNPGVADVLVSNPRQLNLFGKEGGETTLIATAANGSIVYATNVRVSQNITSVDDVLRAAMPGSDVRIMNVGQVAVLMGTVKSPEESAEAARLAYAVLNPGADPSAPCKICVINRLNTATPLQVNLKVKIAEVNRSALKQIGFNLLASGDNGFQFSQGSGIFLPEAGSGNNTDTGKIIRSTIGSTIGRTGKLFGLDLVASLDLAVNDGLASVLAEPNLTALSGETASFLAGGEFPIPVSQAQGAISIEFKQYGVGLAFTPIVLADGRISMRVRPEVSELTSEGSIKIGNFAIPGLTTRRAETTVELGSGQSFMIGGLIRNTTTNNINKAPFLGDLPILGSLFRSTQFRRQETELVIIVTPYLVRPVSGQMRLPTDGYRAPSDPDLGLEGQIFRGVSGPRPAPGAAPSPGLSATSTATTAAAAPGFKL